MGVEELQPAWEILVVVSIEGNSRETNGVDGLAAVNAGVGLGDVAGVKEAGYADAVLLFGQ
jgi:hypothetical protein